MRARKIIFLFLITGMMFQVGLLFNVPLKTSFVTRVVSEPNLIYQPVKEYINATDGGRSAIVYGVGVFNNSLDGRIGELIRINITLRDGTGLDFVDVSQSNFEPDFQETIEDIRNYVERFDATSLLNKDILVTMETSVTNIGGQSASATMTVGLIALVEGKQLRQDVVMTGVLLYNGRVGEIGELDKKIQIAAEAGLAKILIPKSQCNVADTSQNITVKCVEDVEEALNEMTR